MGNGGDLGGKRKTCGEERVGPVPANPDNLESNKEAGGGARDTHTHTHTLRHRMTRMTGPDCVVMCNLINIHTHTHTVSLIPPWEDQCEWHIMTRMTRPDCAVMCNLINTHTHTHTGYFSTPIRRSIDRATPRPRPVSAQPLIARLATPSPSGGKRLIGPLGPLSGEEATAAAAKAAATRRIPDKEATQLLGSTGRCPLAVGVVASTLKQVCIFFWSRLHHITW